MPKDEFWYVVSLLDWSKKSDLLLASAIDYLAKLTVKKIKSFQDILSEKFLMGNNTLKK